VRDNSSTCRSARPLPRAVTALARLAGTERAGRFPDELIARFPTDLQAATVGERAAVDPERLQRKLVRLADFVSAQPGLFRPFVRDERFLASLPETGATIAARESEVWQLLAADDGYLALCHWNANVDNAWFFTDLRGELRCGLMDWGCVGRMHVAMALWGALSAAEPTLRDRHLDELPNYSSRSSRRRAAGPSTLRICVPGCFSTSPSWVSHGCSTSPRCSARDSAIH